MNECNHYLYLLSSPLFDSFKIGITERLANRISSFGLQISVEKSTIYRGRKEDVRNAEKYLHSLLCQHRNHIDHSGGGNTEWFHESCKELAITEINRLNSMWGSVMNCLSIGEFETLLNEKSQKTKHVINKITKTPSAFYIPRKVTGLKREIISVFMQLGVFTPILKSTDRATVEQAFTLNATSEFKSLGMFTSSDVQRVEIHSNALDIDTDLKVWRGVLCAINKFMDESTGDTLQIKFTDFTKLCGYPVTRLKSELRERVNNSIRKLMALRIVKVIRNVPSSLPLIGLSGIDCKTDRVLIRLTRENQPFYSFEYKALTSVTDTTELSRKETAKGIYYFLRSFSVTPHLVDIKILRERLNLSSSPSQQNYVIRKSLKQLSDAGLLYFQERKEGHNVSFEIQKLV